MKKDMLYLRINNNLKEELRKLADANDCTMSDYIRTLVIREVLKNNKDKKLVNLL